MSHGYCDQTDPAQDKMYEVTKAIFSDIISSIESRVIVGYISGHDKVDPVIVFFRQHAIDVIDLRPSSVFYESDVLPFDEHPGPIGQYHYFKKILDYLQTKEG
jgi:hypothetical protein